MSSVISTPNSTPKDKKNGSVLGQKIVLRPLNPYFEEKNQGYRLVQEASQTETNSSKYDAFLVQKKTFYIGIQKLVPLASPANRYFTKIDLHINCVCLVLP